MSHREGFAAPVRIGPAPCRRATCSPPAARLIVENAAMIAGLALALGSAVGTNIGFLFAVRAARIWT